MNESQMKGAVGDMAGSVESAAGALSGDPAAEIVDTAREVAGKVQVTYGDAMDAVSDAGYSLMRGIRANPLAAVLIAGCVGCALGWALSRD